MSLSEIFVKLKDNLRFFRIQDSEIGERYRLIIDEALRNLDSSDDDQDEGVLINIGALRQRAWDLIHTGKWTDVRAEDKYLYTLATYLEVLTEFREHLVAVSGDFKRSAFFLEHSIESLDMGILLGCPVLDDDGGDIFCSAASILSAFLSTIIDPGQFPEKIIAVPEENKSFSGLKTDIPSLDAADLQPTTFIDNYYTKGHPVLIANSLNNWPATEKWKDVSHFQRNFGFRTVPVEIGSQYTTDDWGQELMLFKDFIESQFREPSAGPVQYLAQHDLFKQVPELIQDISRPWMLEELKIMDEDVEKKIWFGPGGTISPLHFDKKENFLCQVIGWKRIVLISPDESPFVYPFEGDLMSNTSQLDLTAEIDEEKFPLSANATRLNVLLGPGQMLFIPYGWWHHVTSLSPSISVSFWWNK